MTYTGNNRVGITVYDPGDLLTLSLLSNIQVTTYNNGVQQESTSSGSLLGLTLLDIFGESDWSMIIVESTQDFDAVEIRKAAVLGALSNLRIGSMCVAPPAL